MTDYKKAFVDTAPFIYFIEKNENNPQYYDKVKKFFSNGYEADKKFVTSVVPSEMAPNMTARWEMDLSPGTVISPFNGPDFLNSISSSQTVRLTAVPFRIYSIPAVSMLRS